MFSFQIKYDNINGFEIKLDFFLWTDLYIRCHYSSIKQIIKYSLDMDIDPKRMYPTKSYDAIM